MSKITKEFNVDDLDQLLNSDLDNVDNDLDINDPELLKQLQELTSSSTPTPTSKSKPKVLNPVADINFNIDAYTKLAQGQDDDDDIKVEFDEKDLNDTNLLNELSLISQESSLAPSQEVNDLINMGFTQKQSESALDMFDNNVERAANYLFDTPVHKEEPTKNDEKKNPQYWKEKVQEYQSLALNAKRQGDKKKAIALLRESKEYNARYQELIQSHEESDKGIAKLTIEQSANSSPPLPKNEATEDRVSTSVDILKADAAKTDISKPEIPTTNIPASAIPKNEIHKSSASQQEIQNLLSKVITLQRQYKEAALHYKKLGNFSIAKQMVRTSKDLLHLGISIKSGERSRLEDIQLPDAPDMTLGNDKPSCPQSQDEIKAQIKYQINMCHQLSLQSKQNRHFSKLEAAFSKDLKSLSGSFHYETVQYVYANKLDEIPENIMQLKILKAIHLPTLDIAGTLEPFVTWDLGGWPPESSPQASLNKGETPVVKDANFDFTLMIPISRSRPFQRYLQRKKLTLEVFHNRYTYGFFRRPISLGKAVIPLDQLLTKATLSGIFDLLDGGRKKTGGKLELQVNLREPLIEKDMMKRTEDWLVLDGSEVSNYLVAAGLSTSAQKPVSPKTEIKTESTTQVEPIKDNELKTAEEEFNSVEALVSNMVLEHELKLTNSELSIYPNKEELIDRKQALDIKMNMLIIQVQTGLLDMETYLKQVEIRMEKDRRLAMIFKRHGRLDLAKAVLVRKKIMQDELEEAKAAIMTQ
ncbi:uncharacterized protein BX663DRAFT_565252 [Cokeromyces recurvatus]|uniref:uncharacterized protein n=1 Tax=Cokeromyces recurvatus TaxID=90255 RepID=UPI0022200734|nr:uncharacterized protein BX663DRAFT_565252 [Cokeromyces recurvatus]KAI7897778.1 hypothetical protein BX663DRAFT_565252 [Cokeromyces recurvatus]